MPYFGDRVEVYVEDPESPGSYIKSSLFIGETDPAIGGDVPYGWLQPSDIGAPAVLYPVVSRQSSLSDVTSTGGTSYVQWGTEEVVFDYTLWSGNVTVEAHLLGYFADVDLNEFIDARLSISVDNGSTWTAGSIAVESRGGSFPSVSVDNRDSVACFQLLSNVTPTGNIQVKAEVRTLTGSNQANFHNGLIVATVRPAHASDN